jgi:hypothetical protein
MRDMLFLRAIGILSILAWTFALRAGPPGHAAAHGSHGHTGHMRHRGGHAGQMGIISPTQLGGHGYLFPGEPVPAGPGSYPGMPIGGGTVVGHEHLVAGHLVGQAGHPHVHILVHVERDDASIPLPTAPGAAEPDQAGAATAQPNPTASPTSPRPPGFAGPGRPTSGRSGPGLPGPGRPASPRW